MKRGRCTLLVLVALPLILAGCSAPKRVIRHAAIPDEHIFFNPEWTGLPTFYIGRTDWPSTLAYSDVGETIAYRETINDRQGYSGAGRDYLIRRFYSVRKGRAKR